MYLYLLIKTAKLGWRFGALVQPQRSLWLLRVTCAGVFQVEESGVIEHGFAVLQSPMLWSALTPKNTAISLISAMEKRSPSSDALPENRRMAAVEWLPRKLLRRVDEPSVFVALVEG